MLGILVAAIVVLAVGASQGLAGASDATTATARFQKHNGNCGIDTGKPFIGKARATLAEDGTLSVLVQLSGADPGEYELQLWTGDPNNFCTQVDTIESFTVGSTGGASRIFTACCYSSGLYFLDARNTSTDKDNDTLIFKL